MITRLHNALTELDDLADETTEKVLKTLNRGESNLTELLISTAGLSQRQVIQFYADALRLPIISQEALAVTIPVSNVSLKFSRQKNIAVINTTDEAVTLVTATPYDDYDQKAVQMACEECDLNIALAMPDEIRLFLERASADEASVAELSEQFEQEAGSEETTDIDRLTDLASEAPIVRLVNVIVAKAMELGASDIHVEPFERHLRVRYRIDGVLQEAESLPTKSVAAVISRIKIMAKLNIAERRLPQDGRIKMRLNAQFLDLRISTVPSLYGESVVMRILDQQRVALKYPQLGFTQKNTTAFKQLIQRPHGIVLVTGPTGSGKTTSLYTALSDINTADKKIMTVEDPIEYQLDGIMQMQSKPEIGLDFASALRAIVRQDPDIIMIGEMRDHETASIAIQSALTGHLVFSTLHTNNAASAVTRLLDMGVEDYLITSTVAGVVAQRLVRTLCPTCKKQVKPLPEVIEEFNLTKWSDEPMLFEPVGCDDCNHSGYKGRSIILEQMTVSETIRKAILAHDDSSVIQQQAIDEGMTTLRDDGILKALSGVTSLQEVVNATQEV